MKKIKEGEELFIKQWHKCCDVMPDTNEAVWFLVDGVLQVGVYEEEQKVFCQADDMGFPLEQVKQWRYVTDKIIDKFPKEKEIIAIEMPEFPCPALAHYTGHYEDPETCNDIKAVYLDGIYEFEYTYDMAVAWEDVFAWYQIPELPLVIITDDCCCGGCNNEEVCEEEVIEEKPISEDDVAEDFNEEEFDIEEYENIDTDAYLSEIKKSKVAESSMKEEYKIHSWDDFSRILDACGWEYVAESQLEDRASKKMFDVMTFKKLSMNSTPIEEFKEKLLDYFGDAVHIGRNIMSHSDKLKVWFEDGYFDMFALEN